MPYWFLYFFSGKTIKIWSHLVLIFSRFELGFLFKSIHCISLVERTVNLTIEQQKCKGHEKRSRLPILKMEINYPIFRRNKSLPMDSVFSDWVNINKKESFKTPSTISISLNAFYFFLRNSKVEGFRNTRSFFFQFPSLITLFHVSWLCYQFLLFWISADYNFSFSCFICDNHDSLRFEISIHTLPVSGLGRSI